MMISFRFVKQVIAFVLVCALSACTEETSEFSATKPRFKELAGPSRTRCNKDLRSQAAEFEPPAGIDRSLIVVTFIENSPQQGHSVIVYNDSTHATATKFKYCDDQQVLTDKLKVISCNEFRSLDNSRVYLVHDNAVGFSYMSGSLSFGAEYQRTDRQLAENNSKWQFPVRVLRVDETK